MANIEIKEVVGKKMLKEFIEFGNELYKDNDNYVYPLLFDEMNTFNPQKNPAYDYCKTILFLAYKEGKIVGRICGLINDAYNKKMNIKHLRFNHYDVIDDIEVSKALFNAIAKWGKSYGMEDFDGPITFTDLDKQGMLMEGFEYPGMFITNYNYPYYVKHMEKLGFSKDVDWVEYRVDLPTEIDKRIEKVAYTLTERYGFKLLKFKKFKDFEPYLYKAFDVYNEAFAPLHGVVEITKKQIDALVDTFLKLINFDYVCVALNNEDEVIGLSILAPSMNKAVNKAKGKLFPLGWFYILRNIKHFDVLDMYFVAIKPEYQSYGINSLMMLDATKTAIKDGVKYAETGPELENNLKIQSQWKNYDAKIIRKRRCWIRKIEEL
ncbi:MAG: hypothetical protein M0P49_03725 [Bacilli bacterium]|nr:hypothetical protein [Bacilli bacterium]